jgi:hypothetical protein
MPGLLEPPYTPFTAADAANHGITRRRLRILLDQRKIRRVLHGVYQCTEADDSIEARAKAAALVLPPHAVICDRTAAWFHGIDTLWSRELEMPPPLDLIVLRSFRARERAEWRNGERDLADHDLMTIFGLRVTTPLRTAMDLGCKLPRRDALAALDSFMRVHALTHDDFLAELPRFRGRRGVIQLRVVIALASPLAESPGESWVRMCLVDAGLPTPVLQHSIRVGGFELYRLDLAYPAHRICIEYDGVDFHETEDQRAADAERREWLRENGWTVIVVTKDDLDKAAVARWTSDVRTVLTRRTPWPRG